MKIKKVTKYKKGVAQSIGVDIIDYCIYIDT